MKLFIFEPHKWDHCGGACSALADSFDDAVDLLKSDHDGRTHGEHYFISDESDYVNRHDLFYGMGLLDGWILTHCIETNEPEPRVLFSNWNHA